LLEVALVVLCASQVIPGFRVSRIPNSGTGEPGISFAEISKEHVVKSHYFNLENLRLILRGFRIPREIPRLFLP